MRFSLLLALPLFALACSKAEQSSGPPAVQAPASQPVAPRQLLEVRSHLEVDVASIGETRSLAAKLDEHARAHGGFVEQSSVDTTGAKLTVRAPVAELPAIRALLGSGGVVAHETVTATDVTDAIADVDARVRAAKSEESRLLALLEKQTGTLADVLAVEKALSDVRERIERLEATQRTAHGRVDLATIEIVLHAGAGAPFAQKIAVAGREGVVFARDLAIGTTTTVVRVAPTLGPIALAAFVAARLARKKRVART